MKNPANVPPITDVRFAAWDEMDPTARQLTHLRGLLQEERVNPGELYGDGFSSVESLSRWAVSWGIGFLTASQEARWLEAARQRVEQENHERLERMLKASIAAFYRGKGVGTS